MKGIAKLAAVGGDSRYHYAHFILEFGRTSARISIEVEGPPPPTGHRAKAYRELLHRIGVLAQTAATGELSMPTTFEQEAGETLGGDNATASLRGV